jgi:hypothetical protein
VARLLKGIFAKLEAGGIRLVRLEVNGQPGAKLVDPGDRVVGVLAIDTAEGKVESVRWPSQGGSGRSRTV